MQDEKYLNLSPFLPSLFPPAQDLRNKLSGEENDLLLTDQVAS